MKPTEPEQPPAMTAEELRDLLARTDVTQVQLAEMLGVNGQTVHRWCHGTHKISRPVATAIIQALKSKK